jgi:hypothetical protein
MAAQMRGLTDIHCALERFGARTICVRRALPAASVSSVEILCFGVSNAGADVFALISSGEALCFFTTDVHG